MTLGSAPHPTDAIAQALARIAEDHSGAVVTVCPDARATSTGPLAGVPFTVKDVLATRGVLSQAGTRALAGHVPADDAPAVSRLREAGAVVVGKTNCSELALSPWTGNPLFGETRHPFAPGRSPGGSSGGCAAAIAAGLVPLGLGTDYGGSVRLPAAACGIVALRPSPGRINAGGQLPPAPPGSPRAAFSLVGPLARDVACLHAALDVLDPSSAAPLTPADALEGVAIRTDDALVRAAARAFDWPTVEPPSLLHAAEHCFTALRELDPYDDLRPLADRLGPSLQRLIERAPDALDTSAQRRLNREAEELRRQADDFMSVHGLIILPVTRGELPPPAGVPVPFDQLGPCRAISLLGLPAVSAGGVQIVARRGRDEDALAAAARLTASTGDPSRCDPIHADNH